MDRLCIYLTYDKQKIIDNYIGYMLKELKTCASRLVVVCNQRNIIQGADILDGYADEVYYRENIGFDAGGFKDALCDYLGWEKVLDYDELVMVNDSMFGPFKPMKEIFTEMNMKSVDFWGLSKHGACEDRKLGYFEEHIQSFFLVISFKMLHCRQFREYWENMPYFTSFVETVKQHEVKFTQYFAGLGYSYDVLANTEINDSVNIVNNYLQYQMIPFELIKKRNFPFLKKQPFAADTLADQTQENFKRAIDYINLETDYDVNLIWTNIIRTFNMTDLQRNFHFQYIISPEHKKTAEADILIAVFIENRYSEEYVIEYIQRLQSDYSVMIFAIEKELLDIYREQGFHCREIAADEIPGLFQDFCDYDFVCFLHDTDMTSDIRPSCTGKSYFFNIWENLAKDKDYVEGIINQFELEPYLGLLAPPSPDFAEYFGENGKGWDGRFDAASKIIKKMEWNCQIDKKKPPFRIADNFWIRGSIFKKLKGLSEEDLSVLSYLWIYLAQDAGYYSGIVENEEYASLHEVNLQYYLREIALEVRKRYGRFHDFFGMKKKIISGALQGFCEKYKRIYVYGIGEMAKQYKELLPDIEAFIVSDGQPKPRELDGIPVKYLSQIAVEDDFGIVICLNEQNQKQVIPLLERNGIYQFFCI